ncbi:hypothetical protein F4815DRAFT_475893 [Daldinia loculata]|nr:hypothetical protein F4815DRAFT_475893 [Daldinia loculata]
MTTTTAVIRPAATPWFLARLRPQQRSATLPLSSRSACWQWADKFATESLPTCGSATIQKTERPTSILSAAEQPPPQLLARIYHHITSEEAYRRVTTNILERHLRANNNVFKPIGLTVMFDLRAQRLGRLNARLPIRELVNLERSRRSRRSRDDENAGTAGAAPQESSGNASSNPDTDTGTGTKQNQKTAEELDDELYEYFHRTPNDE